MTSKRTIRSFPVLCLIFIASLLAVPAAMAETATGGSTAEPRLPASAKKHAGRKADSPAVVSRVKVPGKILRHGSKVRLRGIVERRSSHVGIFFRPSGSSPGWYPLKKVKTDRSGRYSTSIEARRNGQIRAVSSVGTASQPKKIRIRSQISVRPVKKYSPVDSPVLIRGAVSPAGKRPVKVVAGSRVIMTRTTAEGGFKVRWRPGSTGAHRIRVFAVGNGLAASDASRRIRVSGLRQTHASYFGPGLFGGPLACGGRLYAGTRGVAHKTLPCGTKVTLRYRGRTVTTRVVDRGPFVAGREFDLTYATRNDLGFGDLGYVWTNR